MQIANALDKSQVSHRGHDCSHLHKSLDRDTMKGRDIGSRSVVTKCLSRPKPNGSASSYRQSDLVIHNMDSHQPCVCKYNLTRLYRLCENLSIFSLVNS